MSLFDEQHRTPCTGPADAPVTSDQVIREIAKVAFANIGDYMRFEPDGSAWVDLSAMTPDQAAAIAEITVEEFPDRSTPEKREVRRVKVKFHSKKDAFDQLMRHFSNAGEGNTHPLQDRDLEEIRKGRDRIARVARGLDDAQRHPSLPAAPAHAPARPPCGPVQSGDEGDHD